MSDRKQPDTGDLELAELSGDVRALGAQLDGVGKLMSAEVRGLRMQLDGMGERIDELRVSIDSTGKLARRAIAESTENREASLLELRDVERRCVESDARIDARLRALEQRPSGLLTKAQRNKLLAILGALATAIGAASGAVGRLLTDHAPPAQHQTVETQKP